MTARTVEVLTLRIRQHLQMPCYPPSSFPGGTRFDHPKTLGWERPTLGLFARREAGRSLRQVQTICACRAAVFCLPEAPARIGLCSSSPTSSALRISVTLTPHHHHQSRLQESSRFLSGNPSNLCVLVCSHFPVGHGRPTVVASFGVLASFPRTVRAATAAFALVGGLCFATLALSLRRDSLLALRRVDPQVLRLRGSSKASLVRLFRLAITLSHRSRKRSTPRIRSGALSS